MTKESGTVTRWSQYSHDECYAEKRRTESKENMEDAGSRAYLGLGGLNYTLEFVLFLPYLGRKGALI